MSTTPSIQQAFCPHCGFSRQALLFLWVFFFFWMEKRSASLCSIILLSSLLPNTRPSTSLLIFMDLSANGLVILLRSESPVSVSPSSLCRVCLVILNPLQTGEGRANWPPPSSFLLCYLVRCSPPAPSTTTSTLSLDVTSAHHAAQKQHRLASLQAHNQPAIKQRKTFWPLVKVKNTKE